MAVRMLATPPKFALPVNMPGDELVYTTDQSSVLRSPVMPHFGMEGGHASIEGMTSPSPALSPLNGTSFSSFVTAPEVDVSIYNGISHLAGIEGDGSGTGEEGDSGDNKGDSHVGDAERPSIGRTTSGSRTHARAAVGTSGNRNSQLTLPVSAQQQFDQASSPPRHGQNHLDHGETPVGTHASDDDGT